jgi:hypothetical protein
MPGTITLHEAMRRALQIAGHPTTADELAAAVNSAGAYRRRDG